MLLSLSIRDFVIVDLLDLDFSSGFTVLTGETGAGKSIMIDALSLLLGGRGEGSLVRQGAERAELAARFDLSQQPAVLDWLAEQALSGDDDTLLVRRLVDHQGRSRAFLNGRPATLAQLKSVGEHLVDIHGQHAHQSLLRAEAQRVLLDDFAGAQAEAAAVRSRPDPHAPQPPSPAMRRFWFWVGLALLLGLWLGQQLFARIQAEQAARFTQWLLLVLAGVGLLGRSWS